jgi:hypothetical protein
VYDAAAGNYKLPPSAMPRGVVRSKSSANVASVILAGRYPTALSGAAPGQYYLSATTPGGITLQTPPAAVPVLYFDGAYAYVSPRPESFLDRHTHYRFELACATSGWAHTHGGREKVVAVDVTRRGWLPADHASFDGKAPVGAAFGYNFAADSAISAAWPPLPAASAVLVWDKGEGYAGGAIIPTGAAGLCVVDAFGIWWMSDCPGDVPWPVAYEWSSSVSMLEPNDETGPECPRSEEMKLTLYFTTVFGLTDRTTVTSLKAKPTSPLVVTDCDGNVASTGPLQIDLDTSFLSQGDDAATGAIVFKEIHDGSLRRGYVQEGLIAGSGLIATSTHPTALTGGGTLHQGTVTLNADNNLAGRMLNPQNVRLNGVKEHYLASSKIQYLEYPPDRFSEARYLYYLPPVGLPASPQIQIEAWLYAPFSGTLPTLTLTAKRAVDPGSTPTTLSIPGDTAVNLPTNVGIGAGQYVKITSSAIAVAPGDTLYVNLSRSAPDGYTGYVGVLRLVAQLASGL